jgi:hypothetical protein
MTTVERWLLALADPEKPAAILPSARLDARHVPQLCVLAEQHGVLPAGSSSEARGLFSTVTRIAAAGAGHGASYWFKRPCATPRAAVVHRTGLPAGRVRNRRSLRLAWGQDRRGSFGEWRAGIEGADHDSLQRLVVLA